MPSADDMRALEALWHEIGPAFDTILSDHGRNRWEPTQLNISWTTNETALQQARRGAERYLNGDATVPEVHALASMACTVIARLCMEGRRHGFRLPDDTE